MKSLDFNGKETNVPVSIFPKFPFDRGYAFRLPASNTTVCLRLDPLLGEQTIDCAALVF